MTKYLIALLLGLLTTAANAQAPAPIVVRQSISWADLTAGRLKTVPVNLGPKIYWDAVRVGQPITLEIQIDGVSMAELARLRLGASQKAKNSPNSPPVFEVKDWKSGRPLILAFQLFGNPSTTLSSLQVLEPSLATKYPEALVVDFCHDGPTMIRNPFSRKWAFIRPNEQTRLLALHINPLREKVNVSAATVALNSDPATAKGVVSDVLKDAILGASSFAPQSAAPANGRILSGEEDATRLKEILEAANKVNDILDGLSGKDCLTDDMIGQCIVAEREMKNTLGPLTDELLLEVELKRLIPSVATIAARKASPLKEALLALTVYAKRKEAPKEIIAVLKKVGSVPEHTVLISPNFRATDHRQADLFRFVANRLSVTDSEVPPISQTYDVWIAGRAKIDFSAGLVMTSLADQTVAIKDVLTSQTLPVEGVNKPVDVVRQQLIVERHDNVTMALATLAHLYWRTTAYNGGFNVGLTLGGGLTTRGRPLLLAGGSFLLGKQQRIVLSGGMAVGTQKELSARYDTTANYYLTDPADLVYVDRTRVSWFAGLTFNFGKNEKEETIFGKAAK